MKINRRILLSRWVLMLLALLSADNPAWAQGSGHEEFFPNVPHNDLSVSLYQDGPEVVIDTDAFGAYRAIS